MTIDLEREGDALPEHLRPQQQQLARPILDLGVYAWRKTFGDIEAFGTWVGALEPRPCLVLIRAGDYGRDHREVTPCVLRMDSIWRFDERLAEAPQIRETAVEMARFALMMRFEPTPQMMTRLLSIVRSLIEDIIRIPPRPPADRTRVAGEMGVTNPLTGQREEFEIHDDV